MNIVNKEIKAAAALTKVRTAAFTGIRLAAYVSTGCMFRIRPIEGNWMWRTYWPTGKPLI